MARSDISIADKGARHDSLMPLLQAMFREFQDASKKKPEAALNERKVAIVNILLSDIFELLNGEPTRSYLDLLAEDDLPQNSDVVLLLGQAVAAMDAFKTKYFRYDRDIIANRWMEIEKRN